MKQEDINRVRGHALYLKNLFSLLVSKCDALVAMADILESHQAIITNLRMLDLICKAQDMVMSFDLEIEEKEGDANE